MLTRETDAVHVDDVTVVDHFTRRHCRVKKAVGVCFRREGLRVRCDGRGGVWLPATDDDVQRYARDRGRRCRGRHDRRRCSCGRRGRRGRHDRRRSGRRRHDDDDGWRCQYCRRRDCGRRGRCHFLGGSDEGGLGLRTRSRTEDRDECHDQTGGGQVSLQ